MLSPLCAAELAVMDRTYSKATEQLSKMIGDKNIRRADANISQVSEAGKEHFLKQRGKILRQGHAIDITTSACRDSDDDAQEKT